MKGQRLATRFAALEDKVTKLTTLLKENGMCIESKSNSDGHHEFSYPTASSQEKTITEPLDLVTELEFLSTTPSNPTLTSALEEVAANSQYLSASAGGERAILPSYTFNSDLFFEPMLALCGSGIDQFDIGYKGTQTDPRLYCSDFLI
jgi:hypothetical protein